MRPTCCEPAGVAVTIASVETSAGVNPPTSTAPPRNGDAAESCTGSARLPAGAATTSRSGGSRRTTGDGFGVVVDCSVRA